VTRPTLTAPRVAFLLAVAVSWFSMGGRPYIETIRRVRAPNDFTPDYVVAATWLKEGRCGKPWPAVLDRSTANARAVEMGGPDILLLGPYYTHPPTSLPVVMPLVPLGYMGAVLAWVFISVGLLGVLASIVAPILAEAGWPIGAPLLLLILLVWPPSLACFELGQWSFALAATMALSHRAWERGRHRQAATWLAIATALKITPVLVAPGFALRDRRAGLQFAVVLLALVVLCLPFGGVHAWIAMFREAGPNAQAWQTFWDNTTSLNGLLCRLFVGGRFAKAAVVAPRLAWALQVAISGGLIGVAAWTSWSTRNAPPDRPREDCALALWYLLPPILNPLGWSHYVLLLVLPAALVARAAAARKDRRTMALVGAVLVLASFPKVGVYQLTQPFPPPALRTILLSLHLYAFLLLFAAAASVALRHIDKPPALK
jgi:hypothetical protein